MSKLDIERIAILETNHQNVMKQLDDISNSIKSIDNKLDKALEKQDSKFDTLFANKNYLWGAYSVLVITTGVIITLAINAINHKIEVGIAKALENNVESIEYAK